MKKLLTVFVCMVFVVVVHLKVGSNITADKITRYTNNGVVVEKGEKRLYIPNYNILWIDYDKDNERVTQ